MNDILITLKNFDYNKAEGLTFTSNKVIIKNYIIILLNNLLSTV